MTIKTKLISCIVAFIMVASLMLVGIFATQTITMQMGGSVSFNANSVYAKVTGSIKGSQENSTETPLTEFTIEYDDETVIMPSDWTNMGLTFDEKATDIVVEMTIENLATDRGIEISLNDNSTTTNYQVNKTAGGTSVSGSTDTRTINGGEIVTYIFTLHVQSQNNPASGQFLINYTLNNTEEIEGYNVKFINNSGITIYIEADDAPYQTVNLGETINVNCKKLKISASYGSLENRISSIGEIEFYAGGGLTFFAWIDGVKTETYYSAPSWYVHGENWSGGDSIGYAILNVTKDIVLELI